MSRAGVRTRRAVPLPVDLARAFADYVAASVAAGVVDAMAWRCARKRDGSVWVAVTADDGSEVVVSRLASSTLEALYVLARDTEALAG